MKISDEQLFKLKEVYPDEYSQVYTTLFYSCVKKAVEFFNDSFKVNTWEEFFELNYSIVAEKLLAEYPASLVEPAINLIKLEIEQT